MGKRSRSSSVTSNNSYKATRKVPSDEFFIPEIHEYKCIQEINFNVSQLKQIAKYYKQKVSGNKNELKMRLFHHLRNSKYALMIQKQFRRFIVTSITQLHGPGLLNRSICTNPCDFYSLDPITELPFGRLFTISDNGFVYGFDIDSLSMYIKKQKEVNSKALINPYTNVEFHVNICNYVKKYNKLKHILKFNLREIPAESEEPKQQVITIESKTLEIFQMIDGYGHITDINWFIGLNHRKLIRFNRELYDIWNYRAQLTEDVKRSICHPHGNPFISLYNVNVDMFSVLQNNTLQIMKNILTKGVNNDSSALGAYYILSALTLVSPEAAETNPWLYESVMPHIV
jgi:hypothetical protein